MLTLVCGTSHVLTSTPTPIDAHILPEPLEDDEELLLAIAAELARFIPLVGGPSHAHTILPPLEALAQTEEVRLAPTCSHPPATSTAVTAALTHDTPPASTNTRCSPSLEVMAHTVYA